MPVVFCCPQRGYIFAWRVLSTGSALKPIWSIKKLMILPVSPHGVALNPPCDLLGCIQCFLQESYSSWVVLPSKSFAKLQSLWIGFVKGPSQLLPSSNSPKGRSFNSRSRLGARVETSSSLWLFGLCAVCKWVVAAGAALAGVVCTGQHDTAFGYWQFFLLMEGNGDGKGLSTTDYKCLVSGWGLANPQPFTQRKELGLNWQDCTQGSGFSGQSSTALQFCFGAWGWGSVLMS